jgi:hypothetical protein
MDIRAFGLLWELGSEITDRGVTGDSHALQAASLAAADDASDPWVFTALVHDLAKPLDMVRHGAIIAECFEQLPPDCRWALRFHSASVAWVRGKGKRPPGLSGQAERLATWDAAAFCTLPPKRLLPDFLGVVDAFVC